MIVEIAFSDNYFETFPESRYLLIGAEVIICTKGMRQNSKDLTSADISRKSWTYIEKFHMKFESSTFA
jgi:hypothetical protein